MARNGYPVEFRQRVVDLVESGRRVAEVAAELGISEQSIHTWRRQARIDAGNGNRNPESRLRRTQGTPTPA